MIIYTEEEKKELPFSLPTEEEVDAALEEVSRRIRFALSDYGHYIAVCACTFNTLAEYCEVIPPL